MNPNLRHAQAIPGVTDGRAEGIIDANTLVPVIDSIGLPVARGALSSAEDAALRRWFGDLSDWMATSPLGLEEARAQ